MNYKLQKPYPHQEKFIKWNPKKAILAWEMRVGKSNAACNWIDNPCRTGNTYIITIKQNYKEWVLMETGATVMTKENFKKLAPTIKNPTAIVVDEASFFASGLFIKGRSQLSTALYTLVKTYPGMDVLLLTATPVRQSAWSLHTLMCYIGVYYDWKKWRAEFFQLQKLPFLRFPAWMPKKDWRIKIRPFLEKYCDIVSLKDIVEYLPEAETIIIKVEHKTKYIKPKDAITTWQDEHRFEQNDKLEEIQKLGFKKLILIVFFTEQIDFLKKELEKEKEVFVLDGRTKDAHLVKQQAQESEECYFIVQSSCVMGWDGYTFPAMVFVSMSHSCVDFTQAKGRQRHLKHLHPIFMYFLVGGVWDKRILDCVMASKDFNPFIYLHD